MIPRPATEGDHAAVAAVVRAAFSGGRAGGAQEVAIVDGVRAEGRAVVDLVAEADGEIVGHVLFSRMTCEPAAFIVGLGPLAVAPDRQGQGIGAALTRAGLKACRDLGARGAVVLGIPAYYPRFGFSTAAAANLRSPYQGLPAFMAMELVPGGLRDVVKVDYPAAFS